MPERCPTIFWQPRGSRHRSSRRQVVSLLDLTPHLISLACVALLAACSATPHANVPAVATIGHLGTAAPTSAPGSSIVGGREKAISAYRKYLQRYPDTPQRWDVARRLADLLLESASDQRATVPTDGEDVATLPATASQRYLEAITIYESLLHQQPNGGSQGELLYQLARAYEESGQSATTMTLLTQLAEPTSDTEATVYGDGQFRRGELLFAARSFVEAEQAYRRVVDLGQHTALYRQSLYKLGWSLFKQERYAEAVEVFFTFLDHQIPIGDGSAQFSDLSRAEREQLADVFRAVALCFSALGGVAALDQSLAQQERRSFDDRLYRSLGALYVDEERYSDAAETYLALARRSPSSAEAPQLYITVIEIYQRAGFTDRIVGAKAEFAAKFAPHSDFWRHQPPMPAMIERVQTSMAELAHHYHAEFRQNKSVASYRKAANWYRAYLGAYDDSQQAAEMNFRLAELLYEYRQYPHAANEYARTAYAREPHPLGAEAGYRVILARAEHQKTLSGQRKASWAEESIAGALQFVETYSDHLQAPAVLAVIGADLLDGQAYSRAIEVGEGLLQRRPPPPPALRQQASILLAQAQFKSGDYVAAQRHYEEALQFVNGDLARRTSLREGLAASIYQQAQTRLAQDDTRQASTLFLRAAETAPRSPIRPQALYDAAAALLALQQWGEAADLLERFQRAYPTHPLGPQAMQKLAVALEKSGRTAEAARAYLRLSESQRDAKVRRAAMLQAANLYREGGQTDAAIATLERYLERFPRPVAAAITARERLARLAALDKDVERHRYWLTQIVEAERTAGRARSQQTRERAAQAALQLAENSVTTFHRAHLIEPLETSLPRKLEVMRKALRELEQAAEYAVFPVTTAATYYIADLYHELSRELLASAPPKRLTSEQRAQYSLMLKEQAFPFEEKAILFYEANARRISEGQGDPWIAKSLERLAELVPSRYARKQ